MKKIITTGLISILALSACAGEGGSGRGVGKQDIGTVLGAVGGAVAGNQFGKGQGRVVGIAAGTLLGAALGSEIGKSLDRADMSYYNQTSQTALERNRVGQGSSWRNPDSGNSGVIIPTKTYQSDDGAYCREYTQKITVGGRTQEGYGTACRQPDGAWKIIE